LTHFSDMRFLLLQEVPPDVGPVVSAGSLIALALLVLLLALALIAGIVFLVKRIKRRKADHNTLAAKSSHDFSSK